MTAQQWRWLAVLMVAETVSGFEASMILAGLSAWQRELGDPVQVGWIVTSYLLVAATASALLGRLGDIFGRKLVLTMVIATCGLGSLLSAASQDVTLIIIGRGIQGVAGAVIPLCYGMINEYLPKDRVPFGVGMIVATAAAASAIGLLIGGILTDNFGPNSIFWSSAALAAIVLPIVIFGLPSSARKPFPDNFDWMGAVLYGPGIGAFLYALSQLGKDGQGSTIAIASAVGALLLFWWYRHERSHPTPLIDVAQLTNRNIVLANLAMVALAAGSMQLTQVISLLVQQPVETGTGMGTSATFLGAIKLPTVLIGMVGSIGAGWLIPRYGQRLPLLIGGLMIAATTISVAFIQTNLVLIILVICISSIGINAAYASIPVVIMNSTAPDRTSEATGLMVVFRATGQAVGAQTLALLMSLSLVSLPDGRVYTAYDGYLLAFLFISVTGLGVSIVTLGIRKAGGMAGEAMKT